MTPGDHITVPARVAWHGETPLVTFMSIAASDLDAPFLDDALAVGRVTHFAPLDAIGLDDADLRLAGGIHHLTRCGSTLVRRQLDALPGVTALSEPFAFLQLLDGPRAEAAVTRRRIRRLVAAWRDALPGETLVIKWPTLLAQHAATLAAALPEVPMILLHRDPVEILASIAAEPLGGIENLQPHHIGGAVPSDPLTAWATMLARTCRIAADAADHVATVDYAELPAAGWATIAPYFGLTSVGGEQAMRAVSGVHSKHRQPFVADGEAKRAAADAHLRHVAATILAPARDAMLRRIPALSSPALSMHDARRN